MLPDGEAYGGIPRLGPNLVPQPSDFAKTVACAGTADCLDVDTGAPEDRIGIATIKPERIDDRRCGCRKRSVLEQHRFMESWGLASDYNSRALSEVSG